MSRTFHEPERRNPELIARRKLRRNDWGFVEASPTTSYKTNNHISNKAKKELVKIIEWSRKAQDFVNTIKEWEEEFKGYVCNGDSQALKCIQDEVEHPIYSRYTQRKVDEILAPNTKLTEVYLSPPEPKLLLSYSPTTTATLSSEEKTKELVKIWWLVYALLPPKEVLEVMNFVAWYIEKIQQWIEQIETHINIALARPLDDIQ